MTPTEKAQLLQAVAEMANANNNNPGQTFYSVRDNCRDVANLILESIKKDFKPATPLSPSMTSPK